MQAEAPQNRSTVCGAVHRRRTHLKRPGVGSLDKECLKALVGDEGEAVDGEYVRVAAPDPGDGLVAELAHLARQVGVRAQLRGDVVGRGGVEVGPRVQPHVARVPPRRARIQRPARQHCNPTSTYRYSEEIFINRAAGRFDLV